MVKYNVYKWQSRVHSVRVGEITLTEDANEEDVQATLTDAGFLALDDEIVINLGAGDEFHVEVDGTALYTLEEEI